MRLLCAIPAFFFDIYGVFFVFSSTLKYWQILQCCFDTYYRSLLFCTYFWFWEKEWSRGHMRSCDNVYISALGQCLWLTNLAGWWIRVLAFHLQSHIPVWQSVHVKSLGKLDILYLQFHIPFSLQNYMEVGFVQGNLMHKATQNLKPERLYLLHKRHIYYTIPHKLRIDWFRVATGYVHSFFNTDIHNIGVN